MSEPATKDVPDQDEKPFDESGTKRHLAGLAAKLLAGVALAFSAFQLVNAAFSPLSSLPMRSIHVGFLVVLSLMLYAFSKRSDTHRRNTCGPAPCGAV